MSDTLAPLSESKYRPLISSVLSWLKSSGRIDYADLLIEDISRVEMHLLGDGEIDIKPYSGKAMMSVRLVKGRRHFETSIGIALKEDDIIAELPALLELLEKIDEDEGFGLVPVNNREQSRYGMLPSADIREADFGLLAGNLISFVKKEKDRLEKDGTRYSPEIWMFSELHEKFIADTDGVYKTQVLPVSFLQLTVKAMKLDTVTRIRTRIAEIASTDLLFKDEGVLRSDVEEKITACFENAARLQGARTLSSDEIRQLTHYVLCPSAMVFIHEAEGHNFEADIIHAGSSGIYDKTGKAREEGFASACVDVLDGPITGTVEETKTLKGFGSEFIDDEGMEVQTAGLIRGGKLSGEFINSREYAYRYGQKPNGHAFSELGSARLPRMTNTYIAPAAGFCSVKNLGELISDISFGVLLRGSMGGEVSKDGMTTSIQYGFIIRDGQITEEMLLPCSLSVKTIGSLSAVDGFCGEVVVEDPGFCGKGGQHKYVTDGGPFVKIKNSEAICISF